MNCPVCAVPLQIAERQGVEIDYCPQCRGVWLDRGELDKIIERSENYAAGSSPQRTSGMTGTRAYSQERPRSDWDVRREDDDDDDYRHGRRKKRGFLGELFDFD